MKHLLSQAVAPRSSAALLSKVNWFSGASAPFTTAKTSPCTRLPIRQTRQLIHDSKQAQVAHLNLHPADFAFAFDIDGVLLRSSNNLPGATASLGFLHNHNIPFILLTNGGGKLESERVAQLSTKLGVPLSTENFIQSHTPFQQMVTATEEHESLKNKTVLVTGNDQERIREIALKYGFRNVVTPGDILTAYPNIWPFSYLLKDFYTLNARPLPSDPLKIDAVFVFSDPHDWALDTQIILDLLLSKDGVLSTYSAKNGDKSLPNNGWYQDGQPKLIFSNPDLFWASSYPQSRLGQGAFRAALQGIWNEVTHGAELPKLVIGKPTRTTYLYAEKILQRHRAELLGSKHEALGPLKKVYMVGDNPESDIRGTNEFKSPEGTQWESVLVKTGVWREGRNPKYKPKVILNDVREAVKWGLRRQGYAFDEKEFLDEAKDASTALQ